VPDAITSPKTFRLVQEAYPAVARRQFARRARLVAGIVLLFCGLLYAVTVLMNGMAPGLALVGPVVVIVVSAVTIAVAWRRTFKHGRVGWASYELTVEPDSVRRLHEGMPPMELARGEVVRVAENDEGMTLLTSRLDRFVFVPRALDGYEEVREHVRAWAPQGAAEAPKGAVIVIARSLVLVAAWVTVGLATTVPLAASAAAVAFALGAWSIYDIVKSPVIEARRKPILAAAFAFIILATLPRIWLLLQTG
jgi:hypothetical protein